MRLVMTTRRATLNHKPTRQKWRTSSTHQRRRLRALQRPNGGPRSPKRLPLLPLRRNLEQPRRRPRQSLQKLHSQSSLNLQRQVLAEGGDLLPTPRNSMQSKWQKRRRFWETTQSSVSRFSPQILEQSRLSICVDAIINPTIALQSVAEDFLESLSQTPGPSQAELINCVLRACGCNDSVDADEVIDYDGVVDKLDDFTEVLKKVSRTPLLTVCVLLTRC